MIQLLEVLIQLNKIRHKSLIFTVSTKLMKFQVMYAEVQHWLRRVWVTLFMGDVGFRRWQLAQIPTLKVQDVRPEL